MLVPLTKEQFIKVIAAMAQEEYKRSGILPSLTIAQACVESKYGKSAPGNMLFGMKWTENCGHDRQDLWTKEWTGSEYVKVKAPFRKYKSWQKSLEDHTDLLMTDRYKKVRECKDYICATQKIWEAGYATSPTYPATLQAVIRLWGLDQYDKSL